MCHRSLTDQQGGQTASRGISTRRLSIVAAQFLVTEDVGFLLALDILGHRQISEICSEGA